MTQMPPSAQPPEDLDGFRLSSDLRNASDVLLQRIHRLYELERRKRELLPDDPEFIRIAREVEDVAREALGATGVQLDLAAQVASRARHGDAAIVDHAIRDTPPGPRDATIILADWRAAERRLAAALPSSDDERAASGEVDRLRREYRQTINLRADLDDLGKL